MKELEKLTLRKLESEVDVLGLKESKDIKGGGIEDNDCVVDAIGYYGYTESQIWERFAQLYGLQGMQDAMTYGMSSQQAQTITNEFLTYAPLSNANDLDTILASGNSAIVTINFSGNYHAMIVLECSANGDYVTYDPETGTTTTTTVSQMSFDYAAGVYGCK